MHLSGILVVAGPGRIDACRRELESLPGVEVFHTHRPSGRLIAVLESAGLEGQERGLRRIQGLPTVRLAALVEHRVVLGGGSANGPPAGEQDPNDLAVGPPSEGG